MRQKVVLWFNKGQEFQFLFCLLPLVCFVPEALLKIKHYTIRVVISCASFFNKSNAAPK